MTPGLIQTSHIGGPYMSDPRLLGKWRRIKVESDTLRVLDPEAEHKTSILANVRVHDTQNIPFGSNLVGLVVCFSPFHGMKSTLLLSAPTLHSYGGSSVHGA